MSSLVATACCRESDHPALHERLTVRQALFFSQIQLSDAVRLRRIDSER